jgi:hypothetical protein
MEVLINSKCALRDVERCDLVTKFSPWKSYQVESPAILVIPQLRMNFPINCSVEAIKLVIVPVQ